MITNTLQAWATSLGIERRTLETRLVKAGTVISIKGGQYSAKEIYAAMCGDKEQAQARKALAEAEAQERENKIAEGELANLPTIESKVWESLLLPLKQAIDSMPAGLAAQCNPDNPKLAREVLSNWVESTKASIREPVK